MPTVAAPLLRTFSESILRAAGVAENKAAIVAASLVAANLRGVDSHGIQLLTYYIDQLLAREMDPAPRAGCLRKRLCLVFDGQNGLGQWVAETCCDHAIRIAGEHGVGMVTARESNHFGACAWWAQKMRAPGRSAS